MTVPQQSTVRGLSGRRFSVEYIIRGDRAEAEKTAGIVANEQTVEFPEEFVPPGQIRDEVMGRVESVEEESAPAGGAGSGGPADGPGGREERYRATITYEEGSAGSDLPQLINLLNGLTSLLPNLQADRLTLPPELAERFPGPRFGLAGIRECIGVHDRPLLCTALKPMGLSVESLAKMATDCALGGLDIMKDDHGITDLPYSPFEERVRRIADAVAEANAKTGFKTVFAANVTAAVDQLLDRALFAQEAGAGMLMVAPAVIGFDAMRMLAADPRIELPIMSHPTVSGGYVTGETAPFSFYLYYGQMHRLAGADASIYANYGGRFPITQEDSHAAVAGCRDEFAGLKPILPMIGGGMTVERGGELREEFGVDSAFLVGGKLHSAEGNLTENVKRFVETVS
ncbi:MAG: RuBisCO large subunit C-terminal-like domain-containing protein [Spirochaetia bacterium]